MTTPNQDQRQSSGRDNEAAWAQQHAAVYRAIHAPISKPQPSGASSCLSDIAYALLIGLTLVFTAIGIGAVVGYLTLLYPSASCELFGLIGLCK